MSCWRTPRTPAETSLQDYVRLIWHRKWLFLLPVVCIMPLARALRGDAEHRYTATAMVLIEDTNPKILAIPEVAALEKSPNFYSTQYEIIKSRAVAEEVVEKLHLDTAPPAAPARPSADGHFASHQSVSRTRVASRDRQCAAHAR